MTVTRREFIATSLATTITGRVLAQAPPRVPTPVTRFEEIRRGVGIFVGLGGTSGYLATPDGALAVDSQYANTAALFIAGLKERSPRGITALLNTHHHVDHTGGNLAFKAAAPHIVAHANARRWHEAEREAVAINAARFGFDYQTALADTTFTERWELRVGDETVVARYFGVGHTNGDVVVFFERANVVHAGDLLFRRVHPRLDIASGGSIVAWIATLDRVVAACGSDTLFISGHSQNGRPQSTLDDVRYFRDYLSAVLSYVQRAKAEGRSKEEMARLTMVPGFGDVTAQNERVTLAGLIEAVYDELSGRPRAAADITGGLASGSGNEKRAASHQSLAASIQSLRPSCSFR